MCVCACVCVRVCVCGCACACVFESVIVFLINPICDSICNESS